MNWETSELLPTAVSPSINTLQKDGEYGIFKSDNYCYTFNIYQKHYFSDSVFECLWLIYLYGPAPGFEVLLSRLDAKLHVADVLAELPGFVAVKCSVL